MPPARQTSQVSMINCKLSVVNAKTYRGESRQRDTTSTRESRPTDSAVTLGRCHGETRCCPRNSVGSQCLGRPSARREKSSHTSGSVDSGLGGQSSWGLQVGFNKPTVVSFQSQGLTPVGVLPPLYCKKWSVRSESYKIAMLTVVVVCIQHVNL